MAKNSKFRKTDNQLVQLLSVVEQASGEVVEYTQSAIQLVNEINNGADHLKQETRDEKMTPEDAQAQYVATIMPLHGKLLNRLEKIAKKLKASVAVTQAIKPLTDEDEE